jgi:hypothetical protein
MGAVVSIPAARDIVFFGLAISSVGQAAISIVKEFGSPTSRLRLS